MRYNLVLGFTGLGIALSLGCNNPPDLTAILESPDQFPVAEIEVSGVATNLQPDSIGNGGFYVLELSGAQNPVNQVLVRSNYLPLPEAEYHVRGRLALDPDRADAVLMLETSRNAGTDWLLLVILAGILAGGILLALTAATVIGTKVKSHHASSTPDLNRFDVGEPLSDYHSRWRPMPLQPNGVQNGDATHQPVHTSPPVHMPQPVAGPIPTVKKTVPFNYLGAELEVIEGPDKGRKFPVAASPLLIGRAGARNNHVALTDDTVSMAHATIRRELDDHSFLLVNDSQTNQAWVNHAPVDECPLTNGSTIRLGSTVLVFYQHSTNGHSKREQSIPARPGRSV